MWCSLVRGWLARLHVLLLSVTLLTVLCAGISVNDEILSHTNPLFVVNHKSNAPQ